jgi:hypothetical protein
MVKRKHKKIAPILTDGRNSTQYIMNNNENSLQAIL